MVGVKIKKSEKRYLERVKDLLRNSNLPFEDIAEHFESFLLAELGNEIIGAIGIEKYSNIALLRSFVVESKYRKNGIGNKLLEYLLEESISKDITEMYLLTTTAQKYFGKNGFQVVERNSLPNVIQNTKEFNSLCPVSAICMQRILK